MRISCDIVESNQYIKQQILNALSIDINNTLDKSINQIRDKLIEILKEAMQQEPEYSALKNGVLKYEFGIPDTSVVDSVVTKLANTLNIIKKPMKIMNIGLSGGLDITAIEIPSFNGLLADPDAIVDDTVRGYQLPWLEWLLLRGNQIIVKKYEVKMGPNPYSRTGNAIMVESNKNWRVPAEFVGTQNNNWITRAIDRVESQIVNVIQKTIEYNI